ncbi:30S ribosomal protein S5 [Cereibacter azotoformans]|uniref:Small ribosomal subunit protein uS5 n=2 Tax=Cereibacter TaxID=1653176 RepID=RS5_CERS5|nr:MULTISPECIES: 30S ribosomal protein S5 [Cereibacter]A4WVJ1.1 RecName: Full=Small ribosomal subunit protein uS5; AltName: Full=30S ribosomal protein S5 [Cereibacter sphaeroides ATCC 17025]AXQ94387.1 30S ribosomal protein S5 [Cereibacter sphaeroides]MBO4167793.1 30S ribosomal protein S5 [Cereibacter azotoformans]PTR18354.1 SSU ribosomal protein S5P [Cereibacter azotoformans]UIJ29930.1 30S ribosomal protein S5 [Cereibacter azotoformans]ULB10625.1 30S ribosomal protein S5 [Cereibacter azotofor
MAERENRRDRRDDRSREETPEFADRLVAINRVSKTVKGGKRFGFAALVVVGDQRGRVGFGKGKAKEVPEAIRKATEQAKRQMIRVALRDGRTLHHDQEGRHGAGKVVMRAAVPGTGIIAGGPMRAVFEMLGIQDVVAKSMGSQNPYNMIRATMDGLKRESSPRQVAQRRGKKVAEILKKPEAEVAEA